MKTTIRPFAKTFTKPSKTKQQFKEAADIHNILHRYRETGEWGERFLSSQRVAMQGDFTDVKDYQEACNIVIQANNSFSQLPSRLRERFANDPAQLLAFLGDAANYDEAVMLGLVEPKPKVEHTQNNDVVDATNQDKIN